MRRQLFSATVLWIQLLSAAKSSPVMVDEERLIKFLLDRQQQFASPDVRPVLDSSNPITVQFLFILNSIVEVNEKKQTITTKANTHMLWTNEFLSWDPSQFGGLKYVFIPSDSIWLPDVVLQNNKDNPPATDKDNRVTVRWQGDTSVGSHFIRTSACVVHMERYPYDQQNCSILFRSQLYSDSALRLVLYGNYSGVSQGAYEPNPEWDLVAASSEIGVRNVDGFDYQFAQINILIQRRPGFYIYILIVPGLLLSTLTPLLFWMPPTRPDRTALGLSLFSSFFILLLVLIQNMPSSASQTQLGIFYCYSMTLIAVSTILSTFVIYISNKSLQAQSPSVPFVVEKIFLELPSKLSIKRLLSSSCFRGNRELSVEKALPTDVDFEKREKWKAVAASLDKLFFTVACTAVVIAIAVLFPH